MKKTIHYDLGYYFNKSDILKAMDIIKKNYPNKYQFKSSNKLDDFSNLIDIEKGNTKKVLDIYECLLINAPDNALIKGLDRDKEMFALYKDYLPINMKKYIGNSNKRIISSVENSLIYDLDELVENLVYYFITKEDKKNKYKLLNENEMKEIEEAFPEFIEDLDELYLYYLGIYHAVELFLYGNVSGNDNINEIMDYLKNKREP